MDNHGKWIVVTPSSFSALSTHSNDMCVFELVLCGDEEGGEVLGEEPGEGRRVGEQDLRGGKIL